MDRPNRTARILFGLSLLAACGDDSGGGQDGGSSGGIDTLTAGTATGMRLDLGGDTDGPGGCAGDGSCRGRIDVLFVIDNSGSMGAEQLNLARNFPLLVDQLENLQDETGMPLNADVNIMVTTTDNGNIKCDPFYKMGRSAEAGAPVSTGCNARIDRFTSHPAVMPPIDEQVACTTVCPNDVEPSDPFINFSAAGTNVPDVPPVDINGDGTDDSNVAQALACLGPQGIDGCGFESPLESMAAALDLNAAHNQASPGFVRSDAGLLAVAIITDEADCSLDDQSVMDDPAFQSTHPQLGTPEPSSAICWNAGVTCDAPDMSGVYPDCRSVDGNGLTPASRYVDLLANLRDTSGKNVVMLGILGVPLVTDRNPDPPFQPTAGGVLDLQYRDWRDPDFPNGGDILPDEWANNVDAAFKQWEFGIGPGCTGEDGMGGFTGQAIPPVRVKEVCESLNVTDDPGTPEDETAIRCCIESICDTDFSPAIRCLTGLIQDAVIPQG